MDINTVLYRMYIYHCASHVSYHVEKQLDYRNVMVSTHQIHIQCRWIYLKTDCNKGIKSSEAQSNVQLLNFFCSTAHFFDNAITVSFSDISCLKVKHIYCGENVAWWDLPLNLNTMKKILVKVVIIYSINYKTQSRMFEKCLWYINICRRVCSYLYSPILIDFWKWHWHLVFQADIIRLHWKFIRIDFHLCVLQSEKVWPWTSILDLKGHNDQSMLSNKWWRTFIKWLSQNFASVVTSVAHSKIMSPKHYQYMFTRAFS